MKELEMGIRLSNKIILEAQTTVLGWFFVFLFLALVMGAGSITDSED